MVLGVSYNSGDGHSASNSQLGKIQKRLRLAFFATPYPSRIPETDPRQPTRRKPIKAGTVPSSNEPTSSPREPLDNKMEVLLIQPLNITSESTASYRSPGKSGDSNVNLSQSMPIYPSCETVVEVHPERGAEGLAVNQSSRLASLRSTKASSSIASLSTESIAVPLHPILTPSTTVDRADAARKVPSRPSTSHGTPERSVASKWSKSPSRRVLAETPSLFPLNDSFLPRAKPPPPLKIQTKHQRNRSLPASAPIGSPHLPRPNCSKHSEPASFFTVPDATLPPTLPQFLGSTLPSSAHSMSATKSPALPHGLSTSAGRLPSKSENIRLASTSSLTRSSSTVTANSVNTEESQISSKFALQWTWTPPSSWSGPPPTSSQEGEEDKAKRNKPRVLSRKNSASRMKGGKNTSASSPSVRKTVGMDRLAEAGAPEEHSVTENVGREEVVVKMQSFDGDEWTERAMEEVIPKLRTLKSSRF
ncbi:hypothetical protein F5I97DRAFT_373696 [Phlebopus sp. FC_14]|nr:hypothetical protein F5I97DRAFT_373696 [Phlebopus sp. FC_14]